MDKNKDFFFEELRKFIVFSGDVAYDSSTIVYARYFEIIDIGGVNFLQFIAQEGCVAAFRNWWKVVDDCNVAIPIPEGKGSSKSFFAAPGT